MEVFERNIEELRTRPNANKILITVAKFSTSFEVVYERKTPEEAWYDLKMSGGGTDFTAPFQHALKLVNEALDKKDEVLIFSFMTDGESSEPIRPVN